MSRESTPLKTFRVYPFDKSGLYYRVIVWATKKEMQDERVRVGLPRLPDCQAHVFSFDSWKCRKGKPDRKLPIMGEIHFHKKRLGMEAISHEAFHATVDILRRHKFDFARLNNNEIDSRTMAGKDEGEETAASLHGRLCRKIVDRLYGFKLI